MRELIWIGPRESDINKLTLFSKSITLFGESPKYSYSKAKSIRINHNFHDARADEFILEHLCNEIHLNPDIGLMFYNPNHAYTFTPEVVSHSLCLNKQPFLHALNDKIKTRAWIAAYCECIPAIIMEASTCSNAMLRDVFPNTKSYILQKNRSSGGYGTFINSRLKNFDCLKFFNPKDKIVISPYFEQSISINMHLIIYKQEVTLFQPSLQLSTIDANNRLIYRGADYSAYAELDKKHKNQIIETAMVIGKQLQRFGYLGVLGIDFLITNGSLYFIEINPRFQASSSLLNYALLNQGYPSLQEQNLNAFIYDIPPKTIPSILCKYSNFCYIRSDGSFSSYVFECCNSIESVIIDNDGHDSSKGDENSYSFRINFPFSISGITPETKICINDNIFSGITHTELSTNNQYQLRTKIQLLNQGIRISQAAFEYIRQYGKPRSAVFDAIDIIIFDKIRVNCPYQSKLTEVSPYSIDYQERVGLHLTYYKNFVSKVMIDLTDPLSEQKTLAGTNYSSIATLATDRVRINHESVCYFKKNNQSCMFCNLPYNNQSYDLMEIYEVIDDYLNKCFFNHFLIGGGSGNIKEESERIKKITRYIKSKCNKRVYVMCLPTDNVSLIHEYYNCGIDEIAFNIEIFDRSIASKIMPGKGLIPLQQYYQALHYATSLWGKSGNVRSLIIAGLEPHDSIVNGVEKLCSLGVQPIISAFRPLTKTKMAELAAPSSQYLEQLYYELSAICKKYNLELGPDCPACQNNTISFSY